MAEGIDNALRTLLVEALPGLFGGSSPAVQIALSGDVLMIDPQSADGAAGLPTPDDRLDHFAFNQDAQLLYTLTQPPYPGPRRVRLTTDSGDALPLRDDEVTWDVADARVFRLHLRPTRELSGITGVQVLYGVTAIFSKLKAVRTLSFDLTADDETKLEPATALVMAVATLDRARFMNVARVTYEDGDYGTDIEVKSLKLQRGERQEAGVRRLTLAAELELKVRRALAEDEGRPIETIRTPGMPQNPDRPVDVRVDLDI
ncbi:MAG TPA: hypothetical protein VGD69_13785 [Herpetosiphonaceae bacterium]